MAGDWRDALYTLLSEDATLSTLTNGHLDPVRSSETSACPRVTWLEVIGVPENTLDGWSGTDRVRLQVDVWAAAPAEATTIKDRIRALMAPRNAAFSSVCITDSDGPVDDGLGLYRRVLEFSLWTL